MSPAIPDWMAREVIQYDLDLAEPPATILDIGANIGAFSFRAARRWPAAKIIAIEPVRENYRQLFDNLQLDKPSNVTLWTMAVRSFGGLAPIRVTVKDHGVTSGFHRLEADQFEREVPCLDAAELPPADFIKLDTEGCEVEILSRLKLADTKALVCEYHRTADFTRILQIMVTNGFLLIEHLPHEQFKSHGILKFARPNTLQRHMQNTNPLPDSTILSGRTADGVTVSLPAGAVRHPFFRPSLAGKKLFIGLPIYQQMPTFFAQCLLALQAQKPLPIDIHICQGDGVARSRNNLTAEFLKSDCTHLLFIDSDLIFSAEHIVALLERNVPIVGGFYPKKQQGPLEWVINTLPGTPGCRPDGLQPLRYIGTGFICIAREVFVQMAEKYPEIAFTEDYGKRETAHDFWSMGVYVDPRDGHRRYLSEDWYFCQRWLDMGGEIFGDCTVALKHYGPTIYPLDTQLPEMTKPRSQAAADTNATE